MPLLSALRVLPGVVALLWFTMSGGPVLAQPGLPSPPDPTQSPTSDTAGTNWDYKLNGQISASQAAYKNWQEGGVNSLALTTSLDGAIERKGDHWAQAHSLRLVLGFIDQENRALRKSEDLIRLQLNFQYQGDGFFKQFSPTLAGNLRTQFAAGFSYSKNPYPEEGHPLSDADPPVQTAAFFAPGTITEAIGLTYQPVKQFSLRFGGASKQTIVTEPNFRVLYGLKPNETTRIEAGGQFASTLDQPLAENVRYNSQLNAFFAVGQLENPPDVIWENVLNLDVNDWLTTEVEFVAIYDEDTIRAIQIKEIISVGISFTLL